METKYGTSGNGQIIVHTPMWLQREMLKNITNTTRSRLSNAQTKWAEDFLDHMTNQHEKIKKVAPAEDPVQTADIQTPVKNHQPISERSLKNNHHGCVGNALRRFKRYIGRLWKR